MKGIFAYHRKLFPYNSKPVLTLAINCIPEKLKGKDKAQDVSVRKEDEPRLVRAARQAEMPSMPEGTGLVTTDARELVHISPLLP